MKKNKIKLLKILGSASLISMPFLLVQCINQRTNDTNQRIDELKKILQDYETTLIDKPLYENINEIIKKDISFFSVNNNFLYLDNLLKIAKKVLTKKVYKNSIPNKIIKFNEKLNVIYEVWTSIINKNKLIDDIELKDFEQLFIKTREDLTIKKVYNEQEFDEIIKKFVIVAKKIRNYYNKKISQHAIEFNTLFTKEFPTLIIKNNLIQNNDLDSIFNIEPKKDDEENNDPKPDGNTSDNEEDAGSNNKDKEIYLDKNSIFVNKKEYLISNFFEEEKAVEVSINEISDGDTAKFISTRSSEQYKVRFSGIDTP
ncbi:hypothetical protein [Metamycoplasma gateae]|uniref:Lipoprotein n=1 Tax=Metamycoplasma gateae TaxID=35769 RepID=A0ABZ2AG94_9BACT|nr:hypothetical protein V2E26_01880 [Metamycoplasma gateae]